MIVHNSKILVRGNLIKATGHKIIKLCTKDIDLYLNYVQIKLTEARRKNNYAYKY